MSNEAPSDKVRAMFANFAALPDEESTPARKTVEELEAEFEKAQEQTLAFEAEAWTARMAQILPGESPIETLLIQAIGERSTSGCANHPRIEGIPLYRIGEWCGYWQVGIGPYFADIAFIREDGKPGVVVECDGHDFHERTKEQAAHDRQRDRWMQTAGWSVLRFTGSEIRRDPHGCAREVVEFLQSPRRAT